jgi:hypothetical protein
LRRERTDQGNLEIHLEALGKNGWAFLRYNKTHTTGFISFSLVQGMQPEKTGKLRA